LQRTLIAMKANPLLQTVKLTDEERLDHVPGLMTGIVEQLRSEAPGQPTRALLQDGARHGVLRRRQHYSESMLVEDVRMVDVSIYDAVQNGLLKLDLSRLIPDLRNVNNALSRHLQESIEAFLTEKAA